MASPAIALLYPTLLASLATDTNTNYTIFSDEHGMSFMIDVSEPEPTPLELEEIKESALKTSLLLYTRNNPQIGQQLFVNDIDSVKNSFWNPDRHTYIITHGWRGDTEPGSACAMIRDAYLSAGDYNVILIDWRTAAGNLWYWKVVKSVPLVAGQLTRLINFLVKNAGLDTSRTRLIGHSLGGHIVGLAARAANGNIAEVMALDPAKLSFESKGPGGRVDKTDADLVQVIHTSSLGIAEPIGDSDFYPNGGNKQPGCSRIGKYNSIAGSIRRSQYSLVGSLVNATELICSARVRALARLRILRRVHREPNRFPRRRGIHGRTKVRSKGARNIHSGDPQIITVRTRMTIDVIVL